MKRFFNISKLCMIAIMCVLFLGVGMNVKAAAPGQVTGLKQQKYGYNAVEITWGVPSGDVKEYRVEYCEDGKFNPATTKIGTTQSAGCQIDKLASGKSYYIRVAATDTEGNIGSYSPSVEVVTCPSGGPTNFKQTKADSKSATFTWKKVPGANMYIIDYKKGNGKVKSKILGDVNSYKFSGSSNAKYIVNIYAVRKSKAGFRAENPSYLAGSVATLPTKITKVKMVTSGEEGNPNAGSVYFSWNANAVAAGYEYIIYGNNNKKMFSKTVNPSSTKLVKIANKKLKNNQFMKIKVRGYIYVNGKKKPGAWSDDYYFAKFPKGKLDKDASKGIKVSWSKITGAKDYTVYISTNRDRGYKKAVTTKKNNCLIKKCNGSKIVSGRTYYIKVVANKKVKGKTYKSDDTWYLSGRIYTTYR